MRQRQGLVWKLIRKKIVSRVPNKKNLEILERDAVRSLERAGHPRELAMPEKLHAEPKNKQVRWHGSGETRLRCLSPAAVCGDAAACPPLCSEGRCGFSKNNNFVGGGKEMEKTKHRPARRENGFFCRREPAGEVEIFDDCLAGSAVGAGSC